MKKQLTTACTAAFLFIGSSAALAFNEPATGVANSVHNINMIPGATQDNQARICAFCHTPHHAIADPTGQEQPLWSHQYTGFATNWTPYHSASMQASISDPLMGPSRLCMSCHDGVVAVDQHYGSAGNKTGLGGDGFGGRDIGMADAKGNANFSNDHPIGFDYTAVAGKAPATGTNKRIWGAAGRIFKGNTNNTALTVADTLYQGKFMTCATCHDVHNKDNATNTAASTRNYFVYAPQDGSQLCLTCHDKGDGN
jgi:Doubled CXXCH motif (Paired_CXXCH_1)